MMLRCVLLVNSIFILLPVLPTVTGDLSSDRQALLDFASAVPHMRRLNWNYNTSVCSSWVGITCNDGGTRVIAVRLPGVGLSGPLPANSIGKLDALRVLSLRSNGLSGYLPSDIPSIPSLQSLYLQHNNFSGEFPSSLSSQLTVMDLSFNSFSGNIPDLNISRLKLLNLSYNKLNGSIPLSLQKFPISSFVGNPFLCGSPLIRACPKSSPSPSSSLSPTVYWPSPVAGKQTSRKNKKLGASAVVGIAVGAASITFLLLALILFCCLRKKDNGSSTLLKGKVANGGKTVKPEDFGSGVQQAEKNKLAFFEGCTFNFDLEDLLRASAEVLGKGSHGTTYKAVLDEGLMMVVKRLRDVGAGKKEFEQQMEVIGRMGQHPNVLPLRAYYYSKDEKLLVCDYLPGGSLSARLHGNRGIGRTPLDWDSRLKISLGTAKGIAHIHSQGGGAKFTHGNIKSSNILLTQDLDGCISDFGLAPLLNSLPTKPGAPDTSLQRRLRPGNPPRNPMCTASAFSSSKYSQGRPL
ncbi:Non-specific serine/threonine protein kinase [Bertholletia excelsa]